LKNSGFTLVELLITIAIIGIGAGVATFSFSTWIRKSRAQSQIRQMSADISELMIRALTSKQRHSITLNETSYVFKAYSSDTYSSDADLLAHGTIISGGTHTVSFSMSSSATSAKFSGKVLEINERGINVNSATPVCFTGSGVTDAAFNCLRIYTLRSDIGKQDASGVCNVP